MSWFKREKCRPVSVCAACRVHFEPRPDDKWPMYCFECRKPHKERADRVGLVKEWAEANYEKLEPQAKKWKAKRDAALQAHFVKLQEQMRPQQSHTTGYGNYADYLGGLFNSTHWIF